MAANRHFRWLLIGILSVCLASCSQVSSPLTTEIGDADSLNQTPPPGNTETPSPNETPTQSPFPWPTSEVFFDGARVTFINNSGVLITAGDKKILIDALYDTNSQRTDIPQEVLQRIVNAEPPFDQIDLVLATHSHPDHFSADLVRDFLRNNEIAVFVSSPNAVRQVEQTGVDFAERLIPVDLEAGESSQLSVSGIELDCLYITHGDIPILNIGVVITVGDYTFFHAGDMNADPVAGDAVSIADLLGYGLPQKEIDIVFLPSHILLVDDYLPLILDGIGASYVSPVHYPYQYPPTQIEEIYSNALIFEDILASWVIPQE